MHKSGLVIPPNRYGSGDVGNRMMTERAAATAVQ